MLDQLRRRRRYLHEIPEIMFDLPKTRAFLLAELASTGALVQETRCGGILAFFGGAAEEAVAFRADMDALEVTEQTGVSFASKHPGKMHACGHDGHMAMLLGLADYISAHRNALRRNVLLIFQPAEESGGGGGKIVEEGVLEQYGVTEIYALHVDPALPMGVVASRPGPFMARSAEVRVRIQGKAAHVARFREGIDGVHAAVLLLHRLYAMEAAMPPETPRLLKFGMVSAGTAVNILAAEARIGGTMRAYDDNVFDAMRRNLLETGREVQASTGAVVEFAFSEGYPAVVNDSKLYERARAALADMKFEVLPEPSLLAEDFAFYLKRVPGIMLRVGLGRPNTELHAANFNFDERALVTGLNALIRLFHQSMEGERS